MIKPKKRRTREERITELQALQARDMLREKLKITLEELAKSCRARDWKKAIQDCEHAEDLLGKLDALGTAS